MNIVETLDKDSVEQVFQRHFNDKHLKLLSLEAEQSSGLGSNDYFNSDIQKWVAELQLSGHHIRRIHWVCKRSKEGLFFRLLSTVSRPFVHELLWYQLARPALAEICPEIHEISADCYYGYVNYEHSLRGHISLPEKMCCLSCWPLLLKPERGVLILENLYHSQQPMKMLDKNQLCSQRQVQSVFRALAIFHGAWFRWLATATQSRPQQHQGLSLKHFHRDQTFLMKFVKPGVRSNATIFAKILRHYGKSEDLVEKWLQYCKTRAVGRIHELLDHKAEQKCSQLVTVIHGDAWTNNFLFSEDELKVKFVDFQMMRLSHPAVDLWMFLSVSTDSAFRKAHLQSCLHSYFDVLQPVLQDIGIQVDFDQFMEEFLSRRDALLVLGSFLMTNALNPTPFELDKLSMVRRAHIKRARELTTPTPDDHPMIIEIRRRIVDLVEEAAELQFI